MSWIRLFKGAIVIMGALIVYLAYKSYRRNKNRSLLYLSIGFAFVTVGEVVAGILFELMGFSLAYIYGVEAGTTSIGLLIILYSIFGRS